MVNFAEIWSNLFDFRERAKRRKHDIPRMLGPDEAENPQTVLVQAKKHLDYWAKVKELSNHQEALESTIQPELIASINRLFSPATAPHEVNFDRGVIYTFLMITDKINKADGQLIIAQNKLTEFEKELHFAGE